MSLTVLNLQLVRVLPYTSKFPFDLRARLKCTIEENIPFGKVSVVCNNCKVAYYVKFCDIFLLGRLSKWEFRM